MFLACLAMFLIDRLHSFEIASIYWQGYLVSVYDRQPAMRLEDSGGLFEASCRLHPVVSCGGDDGIIRTGG